MAAPGPSPEGDMHMPPPLPATIPVLPDSDTSDTRTASSDLTPSRLPPLPVHHPLSFETHDQTDAFPELVSVLPKRPLPSPRSGRSFSLAHLSGPIKRKPLSSTASPAAVRFSKGSAAYADILADLPRPDQRFARSCSLDSPTLYEFPDQRSLLATQSSLNTVLDWPASPDTNEPSSPLSDYFAEPAAVPAVGGAGDAQLRNITGNNPAATQTSHTLSEVESLSAETASLTTQGSVPYELDDLYSIPDSPESPESPGGKRTTIVNTNPKTMSMFSRKSPPPQLNLGSNIRDASAAPSATSLDQNNLNKPLPKSPASSKLSAFFGWATTPSPTTATEYSDKNFSPLPSPTSPKPTTAVTESYEASITKRATFSTNVTDQSNPLQYCEAYLQTPADSTTSLDQLEEMEDELKGISVELASSIRREMDLEDLVDRLQEQINNPQAPGKRTSDYYSDSGYSSAKFSEYDHAKEEISQIQRRADQEKAQIRLELTNKLQDERSKRRSLDQQIQELSRRASELDVAHIHSSDASGRVKELESMCEDLSRKLSEQSEATKNLEGLLNALQGELQTASNERDNLRDEIVPQLRARVEGLEAEAADQAKLAYDTSKMQQELQRLKLQNAELDSLRAQTAELDSLRAQTAELESLRAQTAELDSLKSENAELQMLRSQNAELHMLRSQNAELKQTGTRMSMGMGLSRSVSVTGGSFRKNRTLSIARSNSTKVTEPRDVLAERLKDVEDQRDMLHAALKKLLERQELQNREHTKRIRQLEMERDRLLTASPKRAGYEREVSNLREEISVLRRRAEEAIEQKWQVEKGLAGLKMDLDRAEGEIASLRSLLQEKDILIPEALARPGSSHSQSDLPVSSHSLEQAYEDLQAAYMDALERIKALEENAGPDEKTQLAIQRLEQSVSAAISDRDRARSDAASYLEQIETLQTLEKEHLDTESDLAAQLHESARRVEELAQQVRAQLEANASLRTRLAGTIARGEAEQRVSTDRISGMQARLRTLEEQVVAAQTGAEERVTRHEEELAALRDAHSAQLNRLRDATGGTRRGSGQGQRVFPPKSPLSPMFSLRTSPAPRKSTPPFLGVDDANADANTPNSSQRPGGGLRRSTTEPVDMTAQMATLRGRVSELEGALASADAEMQEVVGRMSAAQIEVLQLQEQREEAVRETRRLQRVLEEERVRVFEGRWRSLSTEVR
ncbi:hypothetical protein CHGG_01015 [Chaetomium globosum CBS 148.51]|uniref:DUF7603 domain-containing protein n=1 Tax=Chaetomium globosum (strain ATCC 6205 / CBS 148.51 / DSM 1962 / NBRC 6347 / NRRL 1970) TaxID=306901 RepID=Q2HFI9_CHAGB|nr:uncharacterized protein CHGG_01015 [Chaetomium globosum CBS 148.51]EAQ92780.1 hypothetical protein CHGG_01015 [Chaetomium globosum CBS 148.51]